MMTNERRALLIVACALCVLVISVAVPATAFGSSGKRLRVGVIALPEMGHLGPLLSVVDALLKRNKESTADIYLPSNLNGNCTKALSSPEGSLKDHHKPNQRDRVRCLEIEDSFFPLNELTDGFFKDLVSLDPLATFSAVEEHIGSYMKQTGLPMLKRAQKEHATEKPYDVFITDTGAWAGTLIADSIKVEVVSIWPLTLAFPPTEDPSLPAIGSGVSKHMTFFERAKNFAVQRATRIFQPLTTYRRVNELRTSPEFGSLAPIDRFEWYSRRTVITPSIWGLDVAQPLCPNVHPVGFILPELEDEADNKHKIADMDPEWRRWLQDTCQDVIYVNMGSIAVLPEEMVHKFEDGIDAIVAGDPKKKRCVLWKLPKGSQSYLRNPQYRDGTHERVKISKFLPFAPRAMLAAHEELNIRLFVTHCGDTSVYESVHAGVPLVGVPLFFDQPDVCARVVDAEIGKSINKFDLTGAKLASAVDAMLHPDTAARALSQLRLLRRVGEAQGGAARAAEVVENAAEFGVAPFQCHTVDMHWFLREEWDVFLFYALILFATLKMFFACFCGSGRKKTSERTEEKKKKD